MMEVELYGTRGCHLCDDAEWLLTLFSRARAVQCHYVDIALDESLVVRFGPHIPVVATHAGVMHWPFSLLDLESLLGRTLAEGSG